MDQSNANRASQDFETPLDAYDCQGADDFYVPSGTGWLIENITIPGAGSPEITMFDIFFYGTSVTGIPLASSFKIFPNLTAIYSSGTWNIIIPDGMALSPGHYWISVVDITPYGTYGQFFWKLTNGIYNSNGCWRNPGNGFAYGATTWTPLIDLNVTHDFAFRLEGEVTDEPFLSLSNQVFSSAGTYYSAQNSSLSLTIGESVIETFIAQDNVLNTGFQQVETFVPLMKIWNGSFDDNWSTAENWTATGVPVSIDNVTIPYPLSRMPVVRMPGLSCRSITVSVSASLTINQGCDLKIYGN